jgi:hypothetical protein
MNRLPRLKSLRREGPEEAAAAGYEPAGEEALLWAEIAQQLVEIAQERLGCVLDYSEASISVAEQAVVTLVERMQATLTGEELAHGVWYRGVQLGAYVGETFIRNEGGSWVFANNPERDAGVLTDDGWIAFPITKAHKRLANGAADSVTSMYRLMAHHRASLPRRGRQPPGARASNSDDGTEKGSQR